LATDRRLAHSIGTLAKVHMRAALSPRHPGAKRTAHLYSGSFAAAFANGILVIQQR
jgi:hypothetical protein